MYSLSPKVELIAPPLIFVDGRVYRVAPSVLMKLSALASNPAGVSKEIDPQLGLRLIELGILERPGSFVLASQSDQVRHPLSIHVRTYSEILLRAFENAGILYPLRNSTQATIAILAGVSCLVWVLGRLQDTGGVGALFGRVEPGLLVAAVGWSVLTMVFHEAAHISAARRAGCRVPRAGIGIYLTSIVCFVDLSAIIDAPPSARRHVDLAGMAADSIAFLALCALSFTGVGSENFLLICGISYFSGLLFTINPWIKSDGYWVMRDSFRSSSFDPSNWILQPLAYLVRLRPCGSFCGDALLLRVHFLAGLVWLAVSVSWSAVVAVSFFGQSSYSGELLGRWAINAATLIVSLVGLSAVALALVKGSQWRSL